MTKYDMKIEKRNKRKEKKKAKKFKKQSKARYTLFNRMSIRTLRILGPIAGLFYIGKHIYESFYVNIYDYVDADKILNLKNVSLLVLFGTILFIVASYMAIKFVKKASLANAVARNEGKPSKVYSPVLVTSLKFVLSSWFFGLLYGFQWIGVHYGEALNKGFERAFIGFCIGFGLVLLADIIEQFILTGIERKQDKARYETQMTIREMSKK